MARTVLWHLELSHYSEKIRWALDYKRVPHVRRAPLPGITGFVGLAKTRQRRFPILELDGRAIPDSTRIVAALEEHAPEPPLYPADPAQRAGALALEDFFDESVAPALRSFAFHHLTQDPQHMLAAVVPHATGTKAAVLRAAFAVAGPYVRADYRTAPDTAPILAGMDRLEQELGGRDYLIGDRFTIADLAGAALFTPLIAPPKRPHQPRALPAPLLELREELEARPGGQWVHEMYGRHR